MAPGLPRRASYAEVGGYYLNTARPIEVFEGEVDPRHATLIVRFPCPANARRFWNSRLYQQTIKPLRENPPAGNYTLTVYPEAELPQCMRGKAGRSAYTASFTPEAREPVRQPHRR